MVDDSTLGLSFIVASFSLSHCWLAGTGGILSSVQHHFILPLSSLINFGGPQLTAIPTVGFSDPILSYFSALRFVFDGLSMLIYGYDKMERGLFKIATFQRWMVLASSPELIEDVRKAPEDILCSTAPRTELLQPEYTLGLGVENDCHTDLIRTKLTRNVAVTFQEVRDELIRTLDVSIPVHGDDWVKVPVVETIQHMICAATNRVFVGTPLCRDKDYQALNLNCIIDVVKVAAVLRIFPKPLKPIVARVISNLPSKFRQEMEFIRPLVEERLAKMEEFGEDWDGKPVRLSTPLDVNVIINAEEQNDMPMWLMTIRSTSVTITNALYDLLSNPEYIEPLRHDAETAVAEEGWTKAGIDKMHKIDSFIRESLRINAPGIYSLPRLALRPFTFSNGVTVPAGTLIAIPSSAIPVDREIYPNPENFDGFRFTQLRESDGAGVTGHQATSTSAEYLSFGYGRHVCPGRFFATNEVKALLAHIVIAYDIKFEERKRAPRNVIADSMRRVPGKANVMFRKRQT
ncbi:cytochrome P450 [Lactarius tabidus]